MSEETAVDHSSGEIALEGMLASPAESDRIQRECLAAAAMAFAGATHVPRERALHQSAMVSLVSAFGTTSFTERQLLETISRQGTLPELREDLVKQLFGSLLQLQVIQPLGGQPDAPSQTYRVSEAIIEKVRNTDRHLEALIANVIDDLFHDLGLTPHGKASARRTLILCLARIMEALGREYAYQFTGNKGREIALDRDVLLKECEQVIKRDKTPIVSPRRMVEAIVELFDRREQCFAQFVFALTQNYFYLRLLGLAGGLDLLSKDRFAGAEFFLDTNVLFALLFGESRHYRNVLELAGVAQDMNISLHTTEMGLEEFRSVIDMHRRLPPELFEQVTDELASKTRSDVLKTYRAEKRSNPNLSPSEFLDRYSDIRSTLRDDWGVTILDGRPETSVASDDLGKTRRILNQCYRRTRSRNKTERALEHDCHVYYLVLSERSEHGSRSAWVLTLDRSLPVAARQLQPADSVSYCMSLDGFLQIMSPYVRADSRQDFADMFVDLVSRNLFPPEEILELEDLELFIEMDVSIQSMPASDIKKVMRTVKTALGGDTREADKKAIEHELRKAFRDPTLSFRVDAQLKLQQRDARIEELTTSMQDLQSKHDQERESIRAALDARDKISEQRFQQLENERAEMKRQADTALSSERTTARRNMAYTALAAALVIAIWQIQWTVWPAIKKPELIKWLGSVAILTTWLGLIAKRERILAVVGILIAILAVVVDHWG